MLNTASMLVTWLLLLLLLALLLLCQDALALLSHREPLSLLLLAATGIMCVMGKA